MPDENELNQGPAIPSQAEKEARRSAMSARKAAEHLHSAADATVDDYRARGKEVWGMRSIGFVVFRTTASNTSARTQQKRSSPH
jgi:hypothetical protein